MVVLDTTSTLRQQYQLHHRLAAARREDMGDSLLYSSFCSLHDGKDKTKQTREYWRHWYYVISFLSRLHALQQICTQN